MFRTAYLKLNTFFHRFPSLPSKKQWKVLVLIFLGVAIAVPVFAGLELSILSVVASLLMPIIHFLGNILLILIEQLIGIFQFSDFIDTPAVQIGWIVIRDLANIAIVVALMIIAFSTVFRIQKYSASQLLLKLVIAAILVNFSRLIAGLLIDAGQVVMLTFVNAFSDIAAGNLTSGFGIDSLLKVATAGESVTGLASVIGSLLLAIALLGIAIGVILVFVVVLLQRIIILWMLVIFSPAAWVAPLIPGGEKISSQWWDKFTKQVFVGPVLAFGFWLSMSVLSGLSAQQSLIELGVKNTDPANFSINGQQAQNTEDVARFVSEVSSPQAMFDFMVVIALLLGTLGLAKEAGGAAGSFAGGVQGRLKGLGEKYSGVRAVRERYQAYRGKREAVRKEGVERFARKLSARQDLTLGRVKEGVKRGAKMGLTVAPALISKGLSKATGGKVKEFKTWRGKGYARTIARGKAEMEKARQTEREDFKGLRNWDKTSRGQLKEILMTGRLKGEGGLPGGTRFTKAERQYAFEQLTKRHGAINRFTKERDGIDGGDLIDYGMDLMGGKNKDKDKYMELMGNLKKSNLKAVTRSKHGYGNIARHDEQVEQIMKEEGGTFTAGVDGAISAGFVDASEREEAMNGRLMITKDMSENKKRLRKNLNDRAQKIQEKAQKKFVKLQEDMQEGWYDFAEDIADGTITMRELNNDKLRKGVLNYKKSFVKNEDGSFKTDDQGNRVVENGFAQYLTELTDSAERIEGWAKQLDYKARNDTFGGLDLSDTSYEDSKDIRFGLLRAGLAKEAFSGGTDRKGKAVSEEFLNEELRQAMEDTRNKASFIQNITSNSIHDSKVAEILRKTTPRSKIEQFRDNREMRAIFDKALPQQLEEFEAEIDGMTGLTAEEKNKAKYGQLKTDASMTKAERDSRNELNRRAQKLRQWTQVMTRDTSMAYGDLSTTTAQEALVENIERGWIDGTNLRETNREGKGQINRTGVRAIAKAIKPNDLARIAEKNKPFAQQLVEELVGEFNDMQRKDTKDSMDEAKRILMQLRTVNRNPLLGGIVPGDVLFTEANDLKPSTSSSS